MTEHAGASSPWRDVARWPVPNAALWLALPLLALAAGVLSRPINPYDYWYSLVLGRHIDVTGHLPRSNLFLYSFAADTPYLPQAWLGQLALYRLFVLGGHTATAFALPLCLFVAWLLVVDRGLRRSGSGRSTGLLCTLSIGLTFAAFSVRTQMFAFPLWAACLWLLVGAADGSLSFRWAWLAVPLTALWANVHGSYFLSPALALCVGIGAIRRRPELTSRWLALVAACGLAGAASPLGVDSYVYVFRYFGTLHAVSEWERPRLSHGEGLYLLAMALVAVGLVIARRRAVALHELLPLCLCGALAFAAERNSFWLASALPVLLAPHVATGSNAAAEPSKVGGVVNAIAVGLSVVSFVAMLPGVLLAPARRAVIATSKRQAEGAGLLDRDHVQGLVARAKALAGPDRRVFHEQRIGGLVEWTLSEPAHPSPVAFVDQRMEIIPASVWREYFDLSAAKPGWAEGLKRNRVGLLLLMRESQGPLIDAATRDGWQAEAEESDFVLLRERAP